MSYIFEAVIHPSPNIIDNVMITAILSPLWPPDPFLMVLMNF